MKDANGIPLKVGDQIVIPCEIKELNNGTEDFCDAKVGIILGRKPLCQKEFFLVINTTQIIKISGVGVKLEL